MRCVTPGGIWIETTGIVVRPRSRPISGGCNLANLPIDLRLADPGLAEDEQARHAPVARVRQDALHLVEDDRRFRVGDPAITSGVADTRLLARGRNKSSSQGVVRRDAYHE